MKRSLLVFVVLMVFACAHYTYAMPTGGQVVGGSATITNPDAATTLINQATDKAIINWNKFNINPNELVKFLQPGSASVTLNRVIGIDPSTILGALQANGRVFLVEPTGVPWITRPKIDVGSPVDFAPSADSGVCFAVFGQVTDSATLEGIPEATVSVNCQSGSHLSLLTDVEGFYGICLPAATTCTACSSAKGYGKGCWGDSTSFAPVDLDTEIVSTDIALQPSQAFIPLSAGWNFISLRRQPCMNDQPATSIESILAGTVGQVRIIWGFDNVTKQWKRWRPDGGSTNTLTDMVVGAGYWIYSSAPCSIDISTWCDAGTRVVRLRDGWNLVGYNAPDKSINDAAASLQGKWGIMWNWKDGNWFGKHPSRSLPVSELANFEEGRAYWIKTTGSGESGTGWNGDTPITISGTNPTLPGDVTVAGTGTLTIQVNPPAITSSGQVTISASNLGLLQNELKTFAVVGMKLVSDEKGALSIRAGTSADTVDVTATKFVLTSNTLNATVTPALKQSSAVTPVSAQVGPISMEIVLPGPGQPSGMISFDPGQSTSTVTIGFDGPAQEAPIFVIDGNPVAITVSTGNIITAGGVAPVTTGSGDIQLGGGIGISSGGVLTTTGSPSTGGISVGP